MFRIKYMVGTDVRTIEVDLPITSIQSFVNTIRYGGGKILSIHRQKWDDVTEWASKLPSRFDFNWITHEKGGE